MERNKNQDMFSDYMENIYEKHVQSKPFPSTPQLGRALLRDPDRMKELKSTAVLLRYLDNYCDTEREIYDTITRQKIWQLVGGVLRGHEFNMELLKDSGFSALMDENYALIVAGMKIEHMPEKELEIMQSLGSVTPKSELSSLMQEVKTSTEKSNELALKNSYQQEKISNTLRKIKLELEDQVLEHTGNMVKPEQPKRWFKGLGKIAQGSALSIANIGLALGAIPVPASPETAGWGSIISSVSGVGMVIDGFGELRGE